MNDQPSTAPKLTPEHIAAQVLTAQFYVFPGTTVTVCCITLRNGYNTIGHSACVSPENFDQQVGEQIAYKNALNEIWQLEGYLLREFLHLEAGARNKGLELPDGSIRPAAHGHTAYAAAPNGSGVPGDAAWPPVGSNGVQPEVWRPADESPKPYESGEGGDYAGAGVSGSWDPNGPDAPVRSAMAIARTELEASAGESCGAAESSVGSSVIESSPGTVDSGDNGSGI